MAKNKTNVYYITVSECVLAEWLDSVSPKVAAKMSAGAAVIRGPGWGWGSTCKMAHSHSGKTGAGCWQEASVTYHRNLFTGLLESTPDMASSSPECQRESKATISEKEQSYNVFDALASEDTRSPFHGILLVTLTNPCTMWERSRIMGTLLGAGLPQQKE